MAARAEVVLGDEEREVLERWARRPTSSQALAFRCQIVLAAAEGRSSKAIAFAGWPHSARYCPSLMSTSLCVTPALKADSSVATASRGRPVRQNTSASLR